MKFFLALIVFAAGGFFYLFLISSAFRIEQVAVSGNKNISEKNIRQTIDEYLNRRFLFFWRPRNIVLAKSEEIYRKILNEYIFIGDVSVMKKYFHKINIVIKEREIFAIWCKVVIRKQNENTNETTANEINKDLLIIKSVEIAEEFIATDECYYIDDTGIIFSEAPQSSEVKISKSGVARFFIKNLAILRLSILKYFWTVAMDVMIPLFNILSPIFTSSS